MPANQDCMHAGNCFCAAKSTTACSTQSYAPLRACVMLQDQHPPHGTAVAWSSAHLLCGFSQLGAFMVHASAAAANSGIQHVYYVRQHCVSCYGTALLRIIAW